MMKKILLSIVVVISFSFCQAQRMEALYKIEHDIMVENGVGMQEKLATVEYTGYLYRDGNRYMYFKKPQYLEKYPDGYIITQQQGNNYQYYQLYMDTLQNIQYKDLDSLVRRYRFDMSGRDQIKENIVQKFEPGFQQWQILPDTKEIQGLLVQKAVLEGNGKPAWQVWFSADIPMGAGVANIFDLPGLVVEATNFVTNERYQLQRYTMDATFSPGVFWPKEFSQPFISRRAIKKP